MSLQFERAGEDRTHTVEHILTEHDLPSADVRSGPGRFYVASARGGVVGRSDAPPAIRETTQFDELCPATAICMRTRL